jgi:hypothetical protein
MSTVLNGKMIIEEDARRMVAYARAQRWIAPEQHRYEFKDDLSFGSSANLRGP